MKKGKNFIIQSVAAIAMGMVSTLFASAQTGPVWTTSKDVQKIQNKKLFADENLRRSHIQVQSVDFPAVAVSKGIHSYANRNTSTQGNMVSKGYPEWIISKGVQRIGRK